MTQQLADEMNISDPEIINEDLIERWRSRTAAIEEVYLEECLEQYEMANGDSSVGMTQADEKISTRDTIER